MSEETNGSDVAAGVSPAVADAPREKLKKKAITADHQVDRDLRARC